MRISLKKMAKQTAALALGLGLVLGVMPVTEVQAAGDAKLFCSQGRESEIQFGAEDLNHIRLEIFYHTFEMPDVVLPQHLVSCSILIVNDVKDLIFQFLRVMRDRIITHPIFHHLL